MVGGPRNDIINCKWIIKKSARGLFIWLVYGLTSFYDICLYLYIR